MLPKYGFLIALSQILAQAAPAIQPPVPLPSAYPLPQITTNASVPTHFGLFGYSFDGSIVNESYYATGIPYHKDGGGIVVRTDDNTFRTMNGGFFGSYSFSIGPNFYLFATNDGKIADWNTYIEIAHPYQEFVFESWKEYWSENGGILQHDHVTCEVLPVWNVLACQLNGTALEFAFCTGQLNNVVAWGHEFSDECTPIVLNVRQVPRDYGEQLLGPYCAEYPKDIDCIIGTGPPYKI